ncbi:Lsr2 family DNA-binding protein [Nonomuraea candida]|uniref:Lsr2 family DNA-binding protein n=1 Tax=Nonomuraea candida TaxID=359159 RepID=UPI000A012F10|nr:histone-like nucleoid-structuring protein Lsr2 [Nonomuraea candida]
MAEKVIRVCDWHTEEVAATHHNEWTNSKGEHRSNDLCAEDQKIFMKAWEAVERGSSLATTRSTKVPAAAATPKKAKGPTEAAQMRAWAKQEGLEVSESGKISFTIEQAWKAAGRPNVLKVNDP